MGYKLFVRTTDRVARIVPSRSTPTIAERVFGEISSEDALANRDSLEDAVRGILVEKGIEDADTYSIVLPDDLRPAVPGTVLEDNKGPLAPIEKDHESDTVDPKTVETKEPEPEVIPPKEVPVKTEVNKTKKEDETKS